MGKRKKAAKKPQGKKRNEPLATVFPCLFCNHEKSVTVKLDKKSGVGQLSCKVCSQQFQCSVNYLSAAVDVYSDWVDACDAVAKESRLDRGHDIAPARAPAGRRAREDDEADNDDGIMDDEDGLGRSPAGRKLSQGRGRGDEEDDIDDDILEDEDGLGGGYRGNGIVADDEEY